jgi:16S rRNA processing protein RimM
MASASDADSPEAAGDAELTLGVVSGVHGIRGALKVHVYDDPLELAAGATVALVEPQSQHRVKVTITRISAVPGKSMARVFTEEVVTRDAAEALRGHELRVHRDALPALEDDEFYLADLMGRPVRGTVGDGPQRELGVVVGLTSNGEQDLLEVLLEGVTWLLPVLPQFIEETSEQGVQVDLPAGMGPEDAR